MINKFAYKNNCQSDQKCQNQESIVKRINFIIKEISDLSDSLFVCNKEFDIIDMMLNLLYFKLMINFNL